MYVYVVGKHTYMYIIVNTCSICGSIENLKRKQNTFPFLFIYIRHFEFLVSVSCPLFLELNFP